MIVEILEEAAQARIQECAPRAVADFKTSVRPIYGLLDGRRLRESATLESSDGIDTLEVPYSGLSARSEVTVCSAHQSGSDQSLNPMTEIIPNKPDVFDRLSPQQLNGLLLLAAGESAKEVAAKVDVTPQTVSLWMNHDQDFRHALWLFKKQALDAARSELQLAAIEAVTVVRKLLQLGASEQTRLKAAQLLLDQLGLVGTYSANGFDGAAITPIGNYAPPPPDLSNQTREAVRRARGALARLRRRLGVVDPRDISRHDPPLVVGNDSLGSEDK